MDYISNTFIYEKNLREMELILRGHISFRKSVDIVFNENERETRFDNIKWIRIAHLGEFARFELLKTRGIPRKGDLIVKDVPIDELAYNIDTKRPELGSSEHSHKIIFTKAETGINEQQMIYRGGELYSLNGYEYEQV